MKSPIVLLRTDLVVILGKSNISYYNYSCTVFSVLGIGLSSFLFHRTHVSHRNKEIAPDSQDTEPFLRFYYERRLFMISRLLTLTAWSMTPPAVWSPFHLAFMLIGILLAAFAAWKLRTRSEAFRLHLLFACWCFLAFSEVYKQLFSLLHRKQPALRLVVFSIPALQPADVPLPAAALCSA